MHVLFTCPNCGAKTEVEETFVGQTGPCYCCGKSVTVPASTDGGPVVGETQSGVGLGMIMTVVVVGTLGAIGVLLLALVVARPVVNSFTRSSQLSACENNLSQLALAMQNYHEDCGSFPPAHLDGPDGTPMHSWRVLLLPYIGHKRLYQQYDLSQPWNSPQNALLARKMPGIYACPADRISRMNNETNYVVIVGRDTLFPGATSINMDQVPDGISSTILIVEVHGSQIGWTDPRDLDARQMRFTVNVEDGQEIGSLHEGGAAYVTADGKTHFLPGNAPPEYVEALASRGGDEAVTPEQVEAYK